MSGDDLLRRLSATLDARRRADPERSYVAALNQRGLDAILRKLSEESTETILAARDAEASGDRAGLVGEIADLWFHSLVLLSRLGGGADEVLDALAARDGVSGLVEKAGRKA